MTRGMRTISWGGGLLAAVALSLAACGDGITKVDKVPVASVDVSAATSTISAQQTVQFTAVARAADNTVIPGVAFSWSSNAPGVATVSASGLVTGVAPGTATISAGASGSAGTTLGTLVVTVTTAAGVLSQVVAGVSEPQLIIGQGTQATVTGRDAGGATVALGTRTVTWTSSNSSIVTVTNSGVVAAIGVGTVTLSVSVSNGATPLTASTQVTANAIADAPTSTDVAMAPASFIPFESVVKVGGTVRFFFTAIDHNVIWNPRLPASPADILVTTNATVLRTFPTVGVFPFECTVHPGMIGRVVVSP